MDKAREYFWNDSIKSIENLYAAELPYPLRSYFHLDNDSLIFDRKKELNYDVKKIIQLTFNAIFS
jgi:hypothetical protein